MPNTNRMAANDPAVARARKNQMPRKSAAAANVTAACPDCERMIKPKPETAATANSARCQGAGRAFNLISPHNSAIQNKTKGASELVIADGSGNKPNGL